MQIIFKTKPTGELVFIAATDTLDQAREIFAGLELESEETKMIMECSEFHQQL